MDCISVLKDFSPLFVSLIDLDVPADFRDVLVGLDVFAGPGIGIDDCQSFARRFPRANIRFGFHRSQLCLKDSAISLADQHLSPGKS